MAEWFFTLAIALIVVAIILGLLGWIGKLGMWLVKWLVIALVILAVILLIL